MRTPQRTIRVLEKRLEQRALKVLESQQDWVIEKMQRFFKRDNTIEAQVEETISQLPSKKQMTEIIMASIYATMKQASDGIIRSLKLSSLGFAFDINMDAQANLYFQQKLSHELSNKDGTIHQTTIDAIVSVITDAVRTGKSYQDAANQILDLGVFSPARAQLIAVQEIGQAYGQGQFITMDNFIVKTGRLVEKRWSTVGDDRVRASHRANEADGWKDFSQGFSGTGEEFAPSSDFRCRCTTQYRVPKNT